MRSGTWEIRSGHPWQIVCRGLLAVFLLILAAGCQPGFKSSIRPLGEVGGGGASTPRLSFFLNLNHPDSPGVRMRVTSFDILAGNEWLPIATAPVELDSLDIKGRQQFLGSVIVPVGNYDRVRLTVANGSVRRGDGGYADVAIGPDRVELVLPAPVTLGPDDSRLLLLNWDVQSSLVSDDRLRPALSIGSPDRQLPVDLVYASCPDIDTIFVVRSDRSWVVDAFGLKGRPTYLHLDPDPAQQRLTVLAAREATVKVVDLSSQRITDSFPIPLTRTPTFMTVSPDGLWAYVLDEGNNYLSRLDLQTGRLAARVHTNYRPQYATYLVDRNLLAVSSALSQMVSFHDPLSLAEVGNIRTGSSPDGLMVTDNHLYIAESGANNVSVYDLATNLILTHLSVGMTPRRLVDSGSRIYVSNFDEGSISVIFPGQSGVGRIISGLGRPLDMVFSQTYQRIYVVDEQALGLGIVDTAVDQFNGYINLGARPLGLATVQ